MKSDQAARSILKGKTPSGIPCFKGSKQMQPIFSAPGTSTASSSAPAALASAVGCLKVLNMGDTGYSQSLQNMALKQGKIDENCVNPLELGIFLQEEPMFVSLTTPYVD